MKMKSQSKIRRWLTLTLSNKKTRTRMENKSYKIKMRSLLNG